MPKYIKRSLVRSCSIGFGFGVGKLIGARDGHDVWFAILTALTTTALLFIIYALWMRASNESFVNARKKDVIKTTTEREYRWDRRSKTIFMLFLGILGSIFVLLMVIFPASEYLTYHQTNLLRGLWTPISTPVFLLGILGMALALVSAGKTRLVVTPSGVTFQSWMYSAWASWNDVHGIETDRSYRSIIFRKVTVRGNFLTRLFLNLFYEFGDGAIPISMFVWRWGESELYSHLLNYLEIET